MKANVGLVMLALFVVPAARAGVLSTVDSVEIDAFQAGRTVVGFDELVVGTSPCFIALDPMQYASLGIEIRAESDGSEQTHVARVPQCGTFGAFLSPPNVIGGGSTAADPNWRETVRFDFPEGASAIGAHNDGTGSRTTLTAYGQEGTVIASVSGDQGFFMGIDEPGIAYALWTWDADQSVPGFSLDNVTFSTVPAAPPPPPLGDGLNGGSQMTAAHGLGADDVDITFDVGTCSDDHAVVLYGDIGNFGGYQGAVATGCNAGSSGSATFSQAGSIWFLVHWVNGNNVAGSAGDATAGERTYTAAGLCGVVSDDTSIQVCN